MRTPLSPSDSEWDWGAMGTTCFRKELTQDSICILPVCWLEDSDSDAPMDHEERVLLGLLADGLPSQHNPPQVRITPVFRLVPKLSPSQIFTVPVQEAGAALTKVCRMISSSGFTKVLLLHANGTGSCWLDEMARELRIDTDLQMFRIQADLLPDSAGLERALREIANHTRSDS